MNYDIEQNNIANFGTNILISILPTHANKIFKGQKSFELRKALPKVIPRKIYLYETGGAKCITGHIVISEVVSGAPKDVWDEVGTRATSKDRFFKYYGSSSKAVAFAITKSVKYRKPISLDCIKSIEPSFRVPQNFLYLSNLPKIESYLELYSFDEALTTVDKSLMLKRYSDENNKLFIGLVEAHIDDSYLETGGDYAKKLIDINRSGTDPEGVFTKQKTILEIFCEDSLAGFVVLSEKIGGSVKTGPFILLEKYCDKGIGVKVRALLHELLSCCGYRKIYCTVPSSNKHAVSYLLKSGYNLEAHLKRHYHGAHDEFVFGYMLSDQRGEGKEFVREFEPLSDFEYLKRKNFEVSLFLEDEFSSYICPVPEGWGHRQVEQSRSPFSKGDNSFKSRVIFTSGNNKVKLACIAALKRGGSAKLTVLSRTAHKGTLKRFIGFIETTLRRARKDRLRKVYTIVAICDTNIIQAFQESGYSPEGVIERPYNDVSDMVVLGKLLDGPAGTSLTS